jgi:hypothetical protein
MLVNRSKLGPGLRRGDGVNSRPRRGEATIAANTQRQFVTLR